MNMQYAMSLWNYWHYVYVSDQAQAAREIARFGFGVEAWYDPNMSEELADALREASSVSVHATGSWMDAWIEESGKTRFDAFKMELDDCAAFNCRTLVLHASHIITKGSDHELDVDLASFLVDYGREVGIEIALENTLEEQGLSYQWEANAIDRIDGLKICLDTGHVYWTDYSMVEYLDAYKHRLVHLHVQDIACEREQPVTEIYGLDHLNPGSGGMGDQDWKLILDTLEEIDFDGMAVFEVRPRHPLQLGLLARDYLESLRA
jgi:sugar phosphate isomerase/epimerase